jgi:hypothetical protein
MADGMPDRTGMRTAMITALTSVRSAGYPKVRAFDEMVDVLNPFDRSQYKAALPSIGHAHSHLMPVEDPDRLEGAIDRAFVEVFGIYGDTRLLRDLFVRQLPDATAMPSAQGALFALRNLDTRLADAVLERAAAHYRDAA